MIRRANKDDFPEILRLYKEGLDELGRKYNENLLQDKIEKAYNLAPCFLLEVCGKICGMAGLTLGNDTETGRITLTEYLFYIEPEYRNFVRLCGLVEECKQFADTHDFPLRLEFQIIKKTAVHERLLRRCGFKAKAIVGVYNE